jgi:hypothetical protein
VRAVVEFAVRVGFVDNVVLLQLLCVGFQVVLGFGVLLFLLGFLILIPEYMQKN